MDGGYAFYLPDDLLVFFFQDFADSDSGRDVHGPPDPSPTDPGSQVYLFCTCTAGDNRPH